ncbi:hypothetical protein AB0J21_17420 [Streptomyces sp. NPDC049954]|uniref:hypothetical protein n=1 Tax=Streptomyces sp. NPDC049954 TaxID=3155779 RepID=UPI00343EC891
MKVRERTADRAATPVQNGMGERLPAPPRERKPALAALAVLLILVGALGATVLVLRAGDRISVVRTTAPIAAGETINDKNTTSVMVAEDTGINYIPWSQRGTVTRTLKAKADIPPGAVVVGEMFGASAATVSDGKALVGIALKEGQYPGGLKSGETVAVYRVSKNAGGTSTGGSSGASGGSTGGQNSLIADNAEVKSVSGSAKGADALDVGDRTLTVVVDEADAQALAQASSAGEAAVALVPGRSKG